MMTEKVYLNQSYKLLTIDAFIKSIYKIDDTKHGSHSIILDQTIFHPQGGGQPSDIGYILTGTGARFDVLMVIASGDQVEHYGNFVNQDDEINFTPENIVTLFVDEIKRIYHSRIHSAGHALDAALKRVGLIDRLKATKGYHFLDGPYVEYDGDITSQEIENLSDLLNIEMKNIIAEAIDSSVNYLDKITASDICKCDVSRYPDSIRVVYVADFPCPCGGTHVDNTSELGKVTISKIKFKKQKLRISYLIE